MLGQQAPRLPETTTETPKLTPEPMPSLYPVVNCNQCQTTTGHRAIGTERTTGLMVYECSICFSIQTEQIKPGTKPVAESTDLGGSPTHAVPTEHIVASADGWATLAQPDRDLNYLEARRSGLHAEVAALNRIIERVRGTKP